MTKRWSSTASLDGKTKRQASKDARLDIKRETLDLEGGGAGMSEQREAIDENHSAKQTR